MAKSLLCRKSVDVYKERKSERHGGSRTVEMKEGVSCEVLSWKCDSSLLR